jgi:hypothetical protein
VDVYEDDSLAVQLNDFNPGIASSGLFWTTRIPAGSLEVNPGRGRAAIQLTDIALDDYGTIDNALFGGGSSEPAVLSYEIHWSGVDSRTRVVNPAGQISGEFVRNSAQMEWAATVGDYSFVSFPASTSSSVFAEVAHEQNGIFFAGG